MTDKQIAEFLSIMDKILIQKNGNLNEQGKEFLKKLIDEMKKQVK